NVFEFLRNSTMDATPYFQPAVGGKPLFIQNQFGATLGGRIVKDKTFFFGSWQSSREVNAAPQIGTVPTAALRQGVFPSQVNDPTTKQPFPNNTISPSVWDPVAAKIFALYPPQNLPGSVRNFFYNPKERVASDTYSIKATLDTPKIKGLPLFTITGFSGLGTAGPGTTPIPASGSGNAPADKSGKIWQLLDNLAWVHDRHTVKMGMDLQRVTMFVYAT